MPIKVLTTGIHNRSTSIVISLVFIPILLHASASTLTFQPAMINKAYGAEFLVRVNQQVFVPGDTLVVYGKGAANDAFLARLFDSTGRAVKIDNIRADEDGFFEKATFEWPEAAPN